MYNSSNYLGTEVVKGSIPRLFETISSDSAVSAMTTSPDSIGDDKISQTMGLNNNRINSNSSNTSNTSNANNTNISNCNVNSYNSIDLTRSSNNYDWNWRNYSLTNNFEHSNDKSNNNGCLAPQTSNNLAIARDNFQAQNKQIVSRIEKSHASQRNNSNNNNNNSNRNKINIETANFGARNEIKSANHKNNENGNANTNTNPNASEQSQTSYKNGVNNNKKMETKKVEMMYNDDCMIVNGINGTRMSSSIISSSIGSNYSNQNQEETPFQHPKSYNDAKWIWRDKLMSKRREQMGFLETIINGKKKDTTRNKNNNSNTNGKKSKSTNLKLSRRFVCLHVHLFACLLVCLFWVCFVFGFCIIFCISFSCLVSFDFMFDFSDTC